MSEADAWSMIDSMLDDDSPVSCDPTRSRDVYQVAIDELTYGGQTGSYNRDDIAAAARAVSGSHAAPAGSTAAFVAAVLTPPTTPPRLNPLRMTLPCRDSGRRHRR